MATELDVRRIESTISYTFRNKAVLVEALTTPHKNELEEGGVATREGNRRLATLGEAVMRLFIIQQWYGGVGNNCKLCCKSSGKRAHYAAALQDILINYVSNVRLCNLATQAGIGNCLLRSPREGDVTIAPATLIMAIKAIIGASWLDNGNILEALRGPLLALGYVLQTFPSTFG